MLALLFLIIVIAWLGLIFILHRKKVLEKYGLSLSGPVLLVHTQRGRGLINKLAKWRLWKYFGSFALGLCIFIMFAMVLLLCWSASLATKIPLERAPSLQMLIGIPGINPLIPLGYGIVALIIGIVVHEFSHGILARVAKIKLKSLGLLFLVIPLGAFAEPDEEQLKKVDKIKRCRVFGAGPAMNVVVALICAVLFSWVFMSAVVPVAEGVFVSGVVEGSPAAASLPLGALITSFNDTSIESPEDFSEEIAKTKAQQPVNITFYYKGSFVSKNIILANRANYTGKDEGKGYLGIAYSDPEATQSLLSRPFSKVSSWRDFIGRGFFYISLPFLALHGYSPLSPPWTDVYTIQGPLSFLPAWLFWLLANIFYWVFWLNLMLGLTNALPAVPLDGGYIFRDLADSALIKRKYTLPLLVALLSGLFLTISLPRFDFSSLTLASIILWIIALCAISSTHMLERKLGFGKAELKPEDREKIVKPLSYILALIILILILWQLAGPRVSALL